MNDWTQILANEFKGSTARELLDECLPCDCSSSGCCRNNDCINRALATECDPSTCPCGSECQNQRFQKRLYPRIEVRETPGKGYGLFALEDLPSDTFVIEYIGEVLDLKAFTRRQRELDRTERAHFYFMTLRASQVIDASAKGNVSRFINHSCSPNCRTEKWIVGRRLAVGIFTVKAVAAGGELTFDYKFERFGAQAQKCLCGEPCCEGFIGKRRKVVERESEDEEESEEEISLHRKLSSVVVPQTIEQIRDIAISCMRISGTDELNDISHSLQGLLLVEQQGLLRRFVQLHGLMILKNLLVQFQHQSPKLLNLILELMGKLPIQTINTIEDCKIMSLLESFMGDCDLAKDLIVKWNNLERVYRIPKLKEAPSSAELNDNVYCLFSKERTQEPPLERKSFQKTDNFKSFSNHTFRKEFPRPNSQSPIEPSLPVKSSNIEGISQDEIKQIIQRAKEKKAHSAALETPEKSIKDQYRDLISSIVVKTLSRHRDLIPQMAFKHLARKITHSLVHKEFEHQSPPNDSGPVALDEERVKKIKKYCIQKAQEFTNQKL